MASTSLARAGSRNRDSGQRLLNDPCLSRHSCVRNPPWAKSAYSASASPLIGLSSKELKRRLEGYQRIVKARLSRHCRVVDAGLVDSDSKAAQAGDLFASHSVQLVICHVTTDATSSQVLPAVQRSRAPVLILNLQPTRALNYGKTDTGEWLANCCACCVPEIACAFERSRIDFHLVTGVLGVEDGEHGESRPDHPDAVRAWQGAYCQSSVISGLFARSPWWK
jgi:hypothetical protein